MNDRKAQARNRLLQSLNLPDVVKNAMSDEQLASASFQQLLNGISARSELLSPGTAIELTVAEVSKMREERRSHHGIKVDW